MTYYSLAASLLCDIHAVFFISCQCIRFSIDCNQQLACIRRALRRKQQENHPQFCVDMYVYTGTCTCTCSFLEEMSIHLALSYCYTMTSSWFNVMTLQFPIYQLYPPACPYVCNQYMYMRYVHAQCERLYM